MINPNAVRSHRTLFQFKHMNIKKVNKNEVGMGVAIST